jgi:pyruvate dehydrogenase (quinone)/pyruvate oxidase
VIEQALQTPGPALVEAVVDPNEPPMPPAIQCEQAEHLVEALARGTKDAGKIVKTIAKDRVREIV